MQFMTYFILAAVCCRTLKSCLKFFCLNLWQQHCFQKPNALSDHFSAETIQRLKLNFWIELNEMGFARLDSCKKLWIRRFI